MYHQELNAKENNPKGYFFISILLTSVKDESPVRVISNSSLKDGAKAFEKMSDESEFKIKGMFVSE